jgi:hypothetical protein
MASSCRPRLAERAALAPEVSLVAGIATSGGWPARPAGSGHRGRHNVEFAPPASDAFAPMARGGTKARIRVTYDAPISTLWCNPDAALPRRPQRSNVSSTATAPRVRGRYMHPHAHPCAARSCVGAFGGGHDRETSLHPTADGWHPRRRSYSDPRGRRARGVRQARSRRLITRHGDEPHFRTIATGIAHHPEIPNVTTVISATQQGPSQPGGQ